MMDGGFSAIGCALQAESPALFLHPTTHLDTPTKRLLNPSDGRHKLTLNALDVPLPTIAGPLPLDELHTKGIGRDLRQNLFLGKVPS